LTAWGRWGKTLIGALGISTEGLKAIRANSTFVSLVLYR